MSLRDQILSSTRLPEETVDMPEWDTTITVRGLTVGEQTEVFRKCRRPDGEIDPERLVYELIIATVYDSDGAKIFDPADRDTLAKMPARPIRRLQEVANRLAGLTDEDRVVRDLGETPDDAG